MSEEPRFWRTLDIRPAPAGWRVCRFYTEADGKVAGSETFSLVGWAIQEETDSYEEYPDSDIGPDERRRRVATVVYVDLPPYLDEIDNDDAVWAIVGPVDADPSPEDKARAQRQYEHTLEWQRKRREEKKAAS